MTAAAANSNPIRMPTPAPRERLLPPSYTATRSAPPAADPKSRLWPFLLQALIWLLGAEFASFAASFLIGFFAALSQSAARVNGAAGWRPGALAFALPGLLALQAVLLLADLRQGRALGQGDLVRGLGAGPMRRHRLVALFAGLTIAWIVTYLACLIHFQAIAPYVARGVPEALALPVSGSPMLVAIRLLLIVLLAPIAEELFFRGWLWTALRQCWGVWPTALCTGGLWLAIHATEGPARAIILLPTAVLLSLARHHSGSVRASMAVHAVNNAAALTIQLAALLLVHA